jgi:hypothetical protein
MDTPGLMPRSNGGPIRAVPDGPGDSATPAQGLGPVDPVASDWAEPMRQDRLPLDRETKELIEDLVQDLRQRCQDLNSLYFSAKCRVDIGLERRVERLVGRG